MSTALGKDTPKLECSLKKLPVWLFLSLKNPVIIFWRFNRLPGWMVLMMN